MSSDKSQETGRVTEQRSQGIVLVVASDAAGLRTIAETLRNAGYVAAEARSFTQARSLLSSLEPSLLITEIKLGAYNGLHLAWLRHGQHPTGSSIVINEHHDPVLVAEAAKLGCPYLLKPIDRQRLLHVVADLLDVGRHERADRRQWPRAEIRGSVALTVERTHAHVIDVSYGGCRLRFPIGADLPLAQSLQLAVPASDAVVDGTLVWRESAQREDVYGVAIHGTEGALDGWRDFVDRITPT